MYKTNGTKSDMPMNADIGNLYKACSLFFTEVGEETLLKFVHFLNSCHTASHSSIVCSSSYYHTFIPWYDKKKLSIK